MRGPARGLAKGVAAVCLVVASASAWRPLTDPLALETGSRLWIDGTSTVRNFTCKATALEAAVDAEGPRDQAVTKVLGGAKAVRTVTLTVPVEKLDCSNGTMNNHMRKALNATKHTTITFALTGYELVAADSVKGTLQGTLTLNGETKPISLPVVFAPAAGGTLRVTGTYPLKMTEWSVQPPKLMMGTMKVREMVNVSFDLLLK